MQSKHSRLALFAVLTLALCVTLGLMAGTAGAAKKKKKKSPFEAVTVTKSNVPIADQPAGGTVWQATNVDLPVAGKGPKRFVRDVELTVQVTGSAANYLDELELRLVAPNGRNVDLNVPSGGPAPNQSYGPTKYTSNTIQGFCLNPVGTPCPDPDNTLFAPFAGTVLDGSLDEFYGVGTKGTWRLKAFDQVDNGVTGVLNTASLTLRPIKPIK